MTLSEYTPGSYPVIPEKNYAKIMKETVEPTLDQTRKSCPVQRPDGLHIYAEQFLTDQTCRGSLLISHGFTESCDKYHEAVYYYLKEGYNVVVLDHRDHGRSRNEISEAIAKRPTQMTVFQDYIDDLHAVVKQNLLPLPRPYFLYGHSMGGAIAATYLEQHPEIFDRAILNSPMLEINGGGVPRWMSKTLTTLFCAFGKGADFLPGQQCFSATPDFENSCDTSKERYDYYFAQQLERPELQSGGSSNRWARECLIACDRLLKKGNCSKVKVPVLLFQAELDTLVMPRGQETFIRRIPNGVLVKVPKAKHEIFMGTDDILPYYWAAIFGWLKKQEA